MLNVETFLNMRCLFRINKTLNFKQHTIHISLTVMMIVFS